MNRPKIHCHVLIGPFFALTFFAACSGTHAPGSEGGDCYPDGSCDLGLICRSGSCEAWVPDDAGVDAGDAGEDGATGGDDGGMGGDDASSGGDDGGLGGDDGGLGGDDGGGDDGGLPECVLDPVTGQHPWDYLYEGLEDLQDQLMRDELLDLVLGHNSLGYDNARAVMFGDLDNVSGRVQCVYTGQWVTTSGIPPGDVMNAEHTWCQSWGADVEPNRSDLHHLFPVVATINSRRNDYHFGVVVNATWSDPSGCAFGTDDSFRWVFEPRDEHKGDCARAMFYYALRYEENIMAFEEEVLRYWNCMDPPDAWEASRNDGVEDRQNNRNPFVDRPDFAESITDF
ncbi:MAG: endonuclease [Deltaproteobacteria bacterium]|nr:endonuclease [Deltaproteobacteria bacterium]